MKKWIIGLAFLFSFNAFLSSAFAGPGARITSDEFNSIISENMELQKDLSQQLQKTVGIEKTALAKKPKMVAIPDMDPVASENVAVNSATTFDTQDAKIQKQKSTEMKRLSQEVKEALSN